MKCSKLLVAAALAFSSCQILQDEAVDQSSSAQALSSVTSSSSGGTSCISSLGYSSAQPVSFTTLGVAVVPTGGCLKENGQWIENGTTVWDNAQSPWYCVDGQPRATGLLAKDKCFYYGEVHSNGDRFLNLRGDSMLSCQGGLVNEGAYKTGRQACYVNGWHALGEVFQRGSEFCQCREDGQLQCRGSNFADSPPAHPVYTYMFGGGWAPFVRIDLDAEGRLSYSKTGGAMYLGVTTDLGIASPRVTDEGQYFSAKLDQKILDELIVKAKNLLATKPTQMTCETTIIDAVEASLKVGNETLSESYCNPVEPEAAKWVQSVHDYFGKDWGNVIQQLAVLKLGTRTNGQ